VNEEQELKEAQEKLREAQERFEAVQRKNLEEAKASLENQEIEEQKLIEEQRQSQEQIEKKRIEKEAKERADFVQREAKRVALDTALSGAESELFELLKKKKALDEDPDAFLQEVRELKAKLIISGEKLHKAKETLRLYTESQQRDLEIKIAQQKKQDEHWLQVRVEKQAAVESERRRKEQEVRAFEAEVDRLEEAKREREKAEKLEQECSAQATFVAEQERVTSLKRTRIRADQTSGHPLQRFFQRPE
jgi:hypothetical protein